ncbi:MAG: bifunctional diaminohydroxyphosphoribosylaminopyrimidine deaminase/5-amino-6-(5-phosphoribosylamino)uracil reductase RibD [Chrysiogenetes bacterium]|nr:bifunctional diaminohydroxyphosphoribosylaminopyrimidine deaminase/5-amino-6-(5-phosphoribosylamino)uracil reductase RibD [Chrysiogenetes bacterium]
MPRKPAPRSQQQTDERYMRRALELAARGRGAVSPNPMVGAVIVKNGRVLAEGWHHEYGGLHAETDALGKLRGSAKGATLYVSLEPCNATGKQPPCTDAILEHGIARVVVGVGDGNSKGKGGIARLKRRGVSVATGVLAEEAVALNEKFFTHVARKRPHTTLKLAATLDGRTATRRGESKWITSPESRKLVHEMRGECDAILCGIGTVLADDPRLTVRPAPAHGRQPIPVILDSKLRIPLDAKVLKTKTARKIVICSTRAPAKREELLVAQGVRVIRVVHQGGKLDLGAAWKALYKEEIGSVFVEGGPKVAASVLATGLVDVLHVFLAPKIIGDEKATPLLSGLKVPHLKNAIALGELSAQQIGPDVLLTARPRR